MPIEAASEAHQTPGIAPPAPWRVKTLSVLPGHRMKVIFRDGTNGVVDFSAINHVAGIRDL
jgi:hypothetical protein